jgi:GxxExxY protein
MEPQMDTNEHGCADSKKIFLFKDETYQIIGCAIEVLNTLGHGLHEKPYENAMAVEFGLKKIPFKQQSRYEVAYKGVKIGEYIPDLIVFNNIIVDLKTISQITNHERGQMLNYLRISGLKVGLILNFSKPKLESERVVL